MFLAFKPSLIADKYSLYSGINLKNIATPMHKVFGKWMLLREYIIVEVPKPDNIVANIHIGKNLSMISSIAYKAPIQPYIENWFEVNDTNPNKAI